MDFKDTRILYWGEFVGFEGGIERYAFQTAAALRRQGCKVNYAGTAPGHGEELFRKGFDRVLSPSEALHSEYDIAILHKLCHLPELTRLRDKFGKRLVFWAHDHSLYCPRTYFYLPFGRKNCHRPYRSWRCTMCALAKSPKKWRGGLGNELRMLTKEAPNKLKLLRTQPAVVLSQFMRNNLIANGFVEQNIFMAPPFITAVGGEKEIMPNRELRLLFLGQLIRGKGCDLLLEVLPRLKTPFRLVIAGDGNDRAMLEAKAERNGIADRVTFTGWLANPEQCFADADVAVFPFRWQEPFGMCGLEAIAHGVPVMAFDVGGVREWLVDGETGIAVPELEVAAMATALDELAEDREKLANMSRQCVKLAEDNFKEERFVQAFAELLRGVEL